MSDPAGPLILVTGGSPTPEEVAVVTATLLATAAAHTTPAAPQGVPAWGRAARMESVGQAPFNSSVDARLQHRPTGALPPPAEQLASG